MTAVYVPGTCCDVLNSTTVKKTWFESIFAAHRNSCHSRVVGSMQCSVPKRKVVSKKKLPMLNWAPVTNTQKTIFEVRGW